VQLIIVFSLAVMLIQMLNSRSYGNLHLILHVPSKGRSVQISFSGLSLPCLYSLPPVHSREAEVLILFNRGSAQLCFEKIDQNQVNMQPNSDIESNGVAIPDRLPRVAYAAVWLGVLAKQHEYGLHVYLCRLLVCAPTLP